jgi:hypothetical protein
MWDYPFSYIDGGYLMSCRVLFTIAEEYSLLSYNKKIWELLDIRNDTWSEYKSDRKLPLKHYRKLCSLIGCPFTEDDQELCQNILNKYFEEKEVQYAV